LKKSSASGSGRADIVGRLKGAFFFDVPMNAWQTLKSMTRRQTCGLALLLLSAVLPACANVAAYERGKLAHPTMVPTDATSVAREHVYAIQEGAMGGSVGASSGCGCN
jgi:hypothetical protein